MRFIFNETYRELLCNAALGELFSKINEHPKLYEIQTRKGIHLEKLSMPYSLHYFRVIQ